MNPSYSTANRLKPMNEISLLQLVGEQSDQIQPALADALTSLPFIDYIEIQVDPDPAQTCLRISQANTAKNLILVATGNSCSQLPAIALAQRASGKQILSYQLIEPDLPAFTDSWPQAPITAHYPTGSRIPKEVTLRGIQIEEFPDAQTFAQFIDNCLP
jgi:hypothetical protein